MQDGNRGVGHGDQGADGEMGGQDGAKSGDHEQGEQATPKREERLGSEKPGEGDSER